ncbi:hypothetical protein FHY18_000477 [Xanthomonas arboricola]|uniref:hypothetical protein n=1 Tax=Xanthomonas sp. 3793 TaxID=3035312 RepID=UPI002168D681|nr:hypothetical protein [Xanthomonas sp. 3793]MCS3744947.1 hypothetical protein [Xanthomonas sp. 3793]
MSHPSQISTLEAFHNAYDVFVFTLGSLAESADKQCELMGDYNTAWELRDDALAGHYLIGSGLFTEQQEAGILEFLAQIDLIPVIEMPFGSGRAVNLAAMQNPAWEPIRDLAQQLLALLPPVTAANRAYLGLSDAPNNSFKPTPLRGAA